MNYKNTFSSSNYKDNITFLMYGNIKLNMEHFFGMEWNMESKILGMRWKWKKIWSI